MFLKTTRVQRGNRTYEYLSLVEAFRGDDGKKRHNTLFGLGEASALRETGELDRIIAALQAHAERRYVDVDELEFDQPGADDRDDGCGPCPVGRPQPAATVRAARP